MRRMASFTHTFAAVSTDVTRAVAHHRRRAAKLLLRIVPCLALLGLASAAAAQQPAPGQWGMRAPVLQPLSELALAEANGKLYLMGGYPANRVTARTVQIYDIATDTWTYGPQLPMPNNHGMAASVNGKIYLIGGQLNADDPPGTDSYVNTVYELDPAVGTWVTKAPMPTARSSGVAVAHGGKIYVAGGRLPRGSDFAAYDPATNTWEVLPNLPTQRNHFTGAAINGRIHYVGGRQGNGLSPLMTTAHEVFDPVTKTWTTAAPMLRPRSGMNGVMARGLFHVWGGEGPAGMFPDHDYYNPQTNTWTELPDMPMPVHGIVGSAFVDGLIWASGGGIHTGGSSGSTMNQVYRPAVGLSNAAKADFNGDGDSDIVWQNNQTGARAIWLMNESTWVGERFLPTIPLDWDIAATGDFNGDGQSDIVWQNNQTGVRAVWLMNGTTWVGERFLPTIPLEWQIVGAAEFNADGHTDIVWQNTVTGVTAVWLMNGTTWVAERFLPTVSTDWRIAGTGEFNRDGQSDLILQNLADGRRSIWLMNGTTRVEERFLPTIALEWRITGTGDFNRDGDSDVIWQNSNTGQRAIWIMDQTTWVGERFLPVIPVEWDMRNR